MKAEFSFSKDHPSLAGHFPEEPIIPGVTLLVQVQEVIHASTVPGEIYKLRSAKFLRPVKPGEPLNISWEKGVSGDLSFHCAIGDVPVLTGVFSRFTPLDWGSGHA
uniref:ApeI dehydratase-like domain-containing protein n=1 Tax=Leptospirillum ferriphilum TaxID=178606 RepID=A0A7C3LU44_9BACT